MALTQNSDWSVDVDPLHNETRLKMPSFIRLFMIKRLVNDTKKNNQIKQLFRNTNKDKKIVETVETFLDQLLQHSLPTIMKNDFNETIHAALIESIFIDIIIKQFRQEYEDLITYKAKNDNSDSESRPEALLFNTKDLMCCVFQFLTDWDDFEFIGDLMNCSLVNSQWLYHVWNPNSKYSMDIRELVCLTAKFYGISDDDDDDKDGVSINVISRQWQRYVNVRSIRCHLGGNLSECVADRLLYDKLSMLGNITHFVGNCGIATIDIIKVIMNKCRTKIEKYNFFVRTHGVDFENEDDAVDAMSPPLLLPNAKYIAINHYYFFLLWTNKCKQLSLQRLQEINKKWWNYVIDNCDCTGIETLIIDSIVFYWQYEKYEQQSEEKEKLLQLLHNFANKFTNIKKLEIIYENFDICILLLWKYLLPIILKNNGKIILKKVEWLNNEEYIKTVSLMKQYKLIAHEINIYVPGMFDVETKNVMEYIRSNNNTEKIVLDGDFYREKILNEGIKLFQNWNEKEKNNIMFSHLMYVDIGSRMKERFEMTIDKMNDLLTCDLILKGKIFLKFNGISITTGIIFRLGDGEKQAKRKEFEILFEKLCKNILPMLSKEKVPISIDVKLETTDNRNKIFLSNEKLLQENGNQVPHCNKYCQPLAKSVISLTGDIFVFKNAQVAPELV